METRTRELLELADCRPISRTSERTCLKGVSQKMAEWYPQCFPSDFLHLPVHTCTPTSRCTHINTKHKKENDSCEKQTIIHTIHSHAKKKSRDLKMIYYRFPKLKRTESQTEEACCVPGRHWLGMVTSHNETDFKDKEFFGQTGSNRFIHGRKRKLRSPQKAPYNDLRQRNKKYNRRMLRPGKLA